VNTFPVESTAVFSSLIGVDGDFVEVGGLAGGTVRTYRLQIETKHVSGAGRISRNLSNIFSRVIITLKSNKINV
jgi:hypothetical protein